MPQILVVRVVTMAAIVVEQLRKQLTRTALHWRQQRGKWIKQNSIFEFPWENRSFQLLFGNMRRFWLLHRLLLCCWLLHKRNYNNPNHYCCLCARHGNYFRCNLHTINFQFRGAHIPLHLPRIDNAVNSSEHFSPEFFRPDCLLSEPNMKRNRFLKIRVSLVSNRNYLESQVSSRVSWMWAIVTEHLV